MTNHPKRLRGYQGSLKSLAVEITRIDYDQQAELFRELSKQYEAKKGNAEERGEEKAARELKRQSDRAGVMSRGLEKLCKYYSSRR